MGVDALRAAVEKEARARIAGILEGATARAQTLGEEAAAEVAEHREQVLREDEKALRREVAERVAAARRNAQKRVLEKRQDLLDRVFARARAELPAVLESEDARARMVELAEQALEHMPPGPVVIACSRGLADALDHALSERPDVDVECDPELDAGFRAVHRTGDLVVDATLSALLEMNRGRLAIDLLARLERPSA